MTQKYNYLSATIALFLACGASAKAQLTITADFTTPDTSGFFAGDATVSTLSNAAAYEATINAALAQFTSEVTTSTPVSLTINVLASPDGLGTSIPVTNFVLDYSTYVAQLAAQLNKSDNDIKAFASLAAYPYSPSQQVSVSAVTALALGDPLYVSAANSAIANNSGLAGTVALNFNLLAASREAEQPGQYDLSSVLLHEVSEILGAGGQGSSIPKIGDTASDVGDLDLYRYSSAGMRSFTNDPNALSYLSIDGGVTKLVNFNQDPRGDYGDYADPGHVQDAFTDSNADNDLGPAELSALDVIGYQLTPLGQQIDAVPEPSTYGLVLGGLVAFGSFSRRRKSA